MRELESRASAHIWLAQEFSGRATATKTPKASAKYYRLALAEYETAHELANTNTDILNNYAYTFWEWKSAGPRSDLGPNDDDARKAETYVTLAFSLTPSTATESREAAVQSTLGEVLIGEHEFGRAIEQLKSAYSKVAGYRHAYFNEIRFDLARAYMSQNHCKKDPHATRLLDEIRTIEATREFRPFTEMLKLRPPGADEWGQSGDIESVMGRLGLCQP
jgi:hypothetical protein